MKKHLPLICLMAVLAPLGALQPLGAQESVAVTALQDLPDLLRENSLSWRSIDTQASLIQGEIEKNRWTFRPDLTLGLSPVYGFASTQTVDTTIPAITESSIHSFGLALGSQWLLPTDGTLGITLEDTLAFSRSEGTTTVAQSPSLGLTYRQPLWVNGKLLAPGLYTASRSLALNLPARKGNLAVLKGRNALIRSAVALYAAADQARLQAELKKQERDLRRKELEVLAQRRSQGLLSGNDYWSGQMEISQTEDLLLELTFQAEEAAAALAAALGMENPPKLSQGILKLNDPSPGRSYFPCWKRSTPTWRSRGCPRKNRSSPKPCPGKPTAEASPWDSALPPRFPPQPPRPPRWEIRSPNSLTKEPGSTPPSPWPSAHPCRVR